MRDGSPVRQDVEKGIETSSDIEIIKGLNEGDVVVTGGAPAGGSQGDPGAAQPAGAAGGGRTRGGTKGGGSK